MTSSLGSFLRPDGFAGPEGLRALAREGSVMLEAASHMRHMRAKKRQHSAAPYAGEHRRPPTVPVLLIPGFMAGDWSLARMAAGLRLEGYRTYRAHIKINAGCTRAALDRMEQRLESIAIRRGSQVMIVGHSLGGMLARGLAARRPDLTEGIITMGSPVLAPGAVHPVLAWDADLLGRLHKAGFTATMSADCTSGPCAREAFEQIQRPLDEAVGYVAIFSQRDGIVSPLSCLDPMAQEHVEVRASHAGMALDPVTFERVVAALRGFEARRASASAGPLAAADLPRAAST